MAAAKKTPNTKAAAKVATSSAPSDGSATDDVAGAAGGAAPINSPEGASGTAREAPSADSGDEAVQASSGTQSAPPPIAASAIRVTSKVPGFRRAGHAWPGRPVTVPVAFFTSDQLDALRDEPNLIVEDIDLS